VVGNYAYIGEGCNLLILDLRSSNPSKTFLMYLTEEVQGIAVSSSIAISHGNVGVSRFSHVSNPDAPLQLASFNTPGNAAACGSNNLLFVCDGDAEAENLRCITPATPVLVGCTVVPGGGG